MFIGSYWFICIYYMDQVAEVKQKTDIVSLISDYIELKKAGTSYKSVCPFHAEKTPSFYVSQELQIFKCFGCQKSGDAFTFLEEYEGMEFYEALKFLADKAGIKLKPVSGRKKSQNERLYEVNNYVSRFYQYCLTKHPVGKPALTYLTKERGLTLKTIENFNLGFSPDQPLALQKYIIERKKVTYQELSQVGITYERNSQSFDRFRGRVIFPLFDHRDNIVGFAGRILPSNPNKEIAKYINTPETAIYHKSSVLYGLNLTKKEIKKKNEVVVVEGEIDMISSFQAGVKNTVAIKGSALTEEQVKLLSRLTRRMVLSLDEDFAGNEAARRGISISEKEGFEIKVAGFSGFKDPADVVQKDPEKLKEYIDKAQGIWDFLIDTTLEKNQGGDGVSRAKLSKELTPILSSIDDKIVQAHYINLVANKLDVPVEAVSAELNSISAKTESKRTKLTEIIRIQEKTRGEILEDRLLAVIFRLSVKYLEKKEVTGFLQTPFAKRIVSEFLNYEKKDNFDPSDFADKIPKELVPGFVDLILTEIPDLEDADEQRLESELELILRQIKILGIKNKLKAVETEIRKLEFSDNKKDLARAENKFSDLTLELSKLEAGDFKGIIL